MSAFEPIAIVGRACVLPDAPSPEALWDNVAAGRSAIRGVDADRWGLAPEDAMGTPDAHEDRAWSDAGGYVRGFDARFDARGFALGEGEVRALDPMFQWAMDCGRGALRDAGLWGAGLAPYAARTAVILGNLSFPTESHSRFAEDVWLASQPAHPALARLREAASRGRARPDARNRFSSGLPALVTARALGLGGPAFCLDAACASSLYAIELACRKLQRGEVDLALAGAVNRADDLFIHVGFCALSALSRTGRSRPFHRDADGLVPAEGAAVLTLMRWSEAKRRGLPIRGVIRSVALSNDGRGRGLLVPSEEGQRRALRAAYERADIAPSEVTLLECHATGTPVGDGTEVRSSAEVFRAARDLPVGSLKSNLGHLVTVAGAAAILKVLSAFEHGIRPPTLHADAPIDALAGTPFRLLREAEPWSGRRLAGVSAFGFGGNNAHAVLAPADDAVDRVTVSVPARITARPRAAVVAVAARAGEALSTEAVREGLKRQTPQIKPMPWVSVELDGLKFPPRDLERTLGQQLALLEVCREAVRGLSLPRERTGVFVGMGCDPEVSKYGARWRALAWGRAVGADSAWITAARDAIIPRLEAAGVLGTMPNIPANRVSSQLDLGGAGFTISSEERSGLDALAVALDALDAGTLDAALVGAVDLSCEPVHREALRALGRGTDTGDAAVALVVLREEHARASGLPVLAWVTPGDGPADALRAGDGTALRADAVFGRAHAAHGLLSLLAALWTVRAPERPAACVVQCAGLEGADALWTVQRGDPIASDARPLHTIRHEARRPAHPPELRLPMPEIPIQRMERAPALPSTLDAVTAPAPVAVPVPVPLPTPVPASAPTVVHAPTAPEPRVEVLSLAEASRVDGRSAWAGDPLVEALRAQGRVAAVQTDFLAQQAAVHHAFLRAMMGGAPLAPSASTSPVISQPFAPDPALVAPTVPAPAHIVAPAPAPVTPAPVAPTAVAHTPAPVVSPAPVAPVALTPAPVAHTPVAALPGPKFSRAQLEVLAGGRISSVFGPQFQAQDGYHRQVRMPEPPLLLADRVTGIDAVPLSMGTGTIWTETDVTADAWYLTPEGRMPAGVMIESGQADLLLISWLGVDMHNQSERVYRLLGCEGSWHGELPKPGDTLQYDIHVDGHASQGDVRLFFFHYDCRVNGELRLRVRNGQAGFFTEAELADSGGVLWSPDEEKIDPSWRMDPPARTCEKRSFSREELLAFARGRPWECFGEGWALTRSHVRTPSIGPERTIFQHRVTDLDPKGGPWGRGYLRAEQDVRPDDWFFDGHFKNDPCMPGTLMFEGCLQMMALYLGSLGFTIERDAWRFEVARGRPYPMRCRGQVTPSSRQVVYELFVKEVLAGPEPTLVADILCTVDGLKAFHAKSVGLSLIPDWPLAQWERLAPHAEQPDGTLVPVSTLGGLRGWVEPSPVASVEGFAFDYRSLLACAWGAPSEAFGPIYQRFDGARRVARLPGPPYHFMSRITKVSDGAGGHGMGAMKVGTTVEVEYDLPAETWYLEQNGARTMPFCVLMEAALQPCGWLASYVGSALTTDVDLLFRNLDGTGTLHEDILPENGTFTTRVRIDAISQSAGMIIESFTVECLQQGRRVFDMKTVFGFFPKEAFENQVGLPVSDTERARFSLPPESVVELDREKPEKLFDGSVRLASPMLLMIDRVVRWEPAGGAKGLGYARAEKDVDTSEWFFKAHFFQDPVQPGSLGIEAFVQLLQWAMLEKGLGADVPDGRFEPIMTGHAVTWKYRGQVVPKNKLITSEVEITSVGRDDKGPFALADCSLWVDGKKIYHAKNLGMRVTAPPPGPRPRGKRTAATDPTGATEASDDPDGAARTDVANRAARTDEASDGSFTLSLARDPWLGDHRPTWTIPAVPLMSMADLLAQRAERDSGRAAVGLRGVQVKRWLAVGPEGARVKTSATGDGDARACDLSVWRDAPDPRLSRFEPVAAGAVLLSSPAPAPAPFAPLSDAAPDEDPYESGALFHGPSFQVVTSLRTGSSGATAVVDLARCAVPRGALHPGILDALTHAIPHDALHRWSSEISSNLVAYPYRLERLDVHARIPDAGEARIEARFAGFDGEDRRFPVIELQLVAAERVLVSARLVEVLLPKGPIGRAGRRERRAFLQDNLPVEGVSLSRDEGGVTVLDPADVAASDWLPGNLAHLYAVPASDRAELPSVIAAKEHVARRAGVHPSRVTVDHARSYGTVDASPLRAYPLRVERSSDEPSRVLVRDAAPPRLDLSGVQRYWDRWFGVGRWPGEDLHYALAEKFVDEVVLTDPEAFARIRGRACLYLANHQVGVESLLFSVLAAGLSEQPVVTLAKAEHRDSWLGHFIRHSFSYPGVRDPRLITFFEREDRAALLEIVGELAGELARGERSVMVHVEGTRSLTCRTPVQKMSSAFIDMALTVGVPIVPVRFVGGIPGEPALERRLEFPVGFGRQSYWIGRPIPPSELAALPYKDRKATVLAAINGLGPGVEREQPYPGDPAFEHAVRQWAARTGATEEHATLFVALARYGVHRCTEDTLAWLRGAETGAYDGGAGPRAEWLKVWARWFYGERGPRVG
jgi:3-oxoacyl-(acyl-carrier-protein) synthase/3-hydroxymyristoyl/3-hydroxydecanoyl-(acyl carrier protein) dehydratase/1-acyl-sn-glycerol-3-phosphate acyltransferase